MPPPLTISSSAISPTAADNRRAPLGQLGGGAALHEADRGPAQPPARRPVADPGDLPLVGHQRDQLDLRAPPDLLRQGDRLLHRVDRGALRPDLDPPAQRPPAGVDVDADPHRRGAGPQHRLDRVQVLGAVDHHDRRPRRVGDRAQRQLPESAGVDGRVGEQQVLEPMLGKPEGLRQGEGQQAGEALVAAKDPLQQRPAAHGLAGDPDRLARRSRQHRVRVAPHRVEVDEGERRLDRLEYLLVLGVGGHRGHEPIPVALTIGALGEVAEWLKALAC